MPTLDYHAATIDSSTDALVHLVIALEHSKGGELEAHILRAIHTASSEVAYVSADMLKQRGKVLHAQTD